MKYDVIVIGGGAAGLMAAGTCAYRGKKVLLIERNRVFGRKLRITGKGRCNVTNNCSVDKVIESTPGNGRFLHSALNLFPPSGAMAFFEKLGVPLKTERGQRVFPRSDDANDIADALVKYCRDGGVETVAAKALEILVTDGLAKGVKTDKGSYMAESVILGTGGASYPGTGSDGSGYALAKAAGHSVTPTRASLVPLIESGNICKEMQGLALKNCKMDVIDNEKGKKIYEDFGELLFTHFGLSGPIVLSASAHMRNISQGRYTVKIDLKPALDMDTLDKRLLRDFEENKNKSFINSLGKLLPKSMIPVIVELSGIDENKRCNSITREERISLLNVLKALKIEIKGFRPISEAIITSGGVEVKEINPKTMESKIVKGLFFAGEVIDVDAYTGGFNLQIAFSTGYCAGVNS